LLLAIIVVKVVSSQSGFNLLQSDYHNYGDNSSAVTLILEFEEIPDALTRRLEWTTKELDDGLTLLSDNLWKLQNFLDTVVRLIRLLPV
jgi:hypothetical protein